MARRPVHSAKPLAAALGKVTSKPFRSRGFAALSVINEWHAIVGADLAGRTTPERLGRDGTLSVRVAGPAATELQHQEPQIIERIARYFGYKAVHRLKFIQAPLPTPDSAKPTKRPQPPSASPVASNKLVTQTRDSDLRAALARLGAAVEVEPGRR
jgi:hypothetical protein